MIDLKRQQIQEEAFQAWCNSGKKNTLELITGLGKTMCAIKAVLSMPKGCSVLWLAETNQRWLDVDRDIIKYKQFYGIDMLKHISTIEKVCYQTAYKWRDKHFDIVVGDELQDCLTEQYSKFFFYNSYNAVIGLSATINRTTEYVCEDGSIITKGDLIDRIAPVCYKYTINNGQIDGTARKLLIHVINHNLDYSNKTVTAGSKTKQFLTTEKAAYDYWDNEFKKALFLPQQIKEFKLRYTSSARARILYNLQSKVISTKKLLEVLKDKTIIFGNSIDSLLKVTPNVISSKNTELKNIKIRNDFDKDKSKVIGSFKMLQQGANLKGLDNIILMSYYSMEKQFIQMLGRARLDGDKIGNVFIFVTSGTTEVKWFAKMTEKFTEFEFIYHDNIDKCIAYVKEKKL